MVKPCNDFLRVSVKRQHHHDSSYKGKKLTGNCSFKRFSLLSLHQEAWQYAHRHGVGEVAEFWICRQWEESDIGPGFSFWNLNTWPSDAFPPTISHQLEQGHISINAPPYLPIATIFIETTTLAHINLSGGFVSKYLVVQRCMVDEYRVKGYWKGWVIHLYLVFKIWD